MDMDARGCWQTDEGLRASSMNVAVARRSSDGVCGVAIVMEVPTITGEPTFVTMKLDPEDAMGMAAAILDAVDMATGKAPLT